MKYVKPKSLTWWTGMAALGMGLVVALGNQWAVFGGVGGFVGDLTGNMEPYALITYGLTTIGIRGALK